MRIFIAGVDGYLGFPLAQHLAARGHEIGGADLFLRRQWVREMGSDSITPIADMDGRREAFALRFGQPLEFWKGDLQDHDFVRRALAEFRPDAIVHLGQMPSAPYSMVDAGHAVFTQTNNLVGTLNLLFAMREICPEAHLLKLGTMGEYGTPDIDIPEGFFEVEFRGRKDVLPFPRQANSWYHWSKVHDSNNVMFACRIWGLSATDVMQGVVFGAESDEPASDPRLATRFDIDQAFGTAVNRFCAQTVIGHPLTLYGKGRQRRGFLPLRDSMQCLTLALENPPARGEYRVFNQFAEVHDVTDIALRVQSAAGRLGLRVEPIHIENPRLEKEEHYYNPDHSNLRDLGYVPARSVDDEITAILKHLEPHRHRIERLRDVLLPDICWDGTRRKADGIPT